MAERSLRGMSIGAKSLESDQNVDFAAREEVAYICPNGHRTILPFANGNVTADPWRVLRVRKIRRTKSPSRLEPTGICCLNDAMRRNWPNFWRSDCRCIAMVGFLITSDLSWPGCDVMFYDLHNRAIV